MASLKRKLRAFKTIGRKPNRSVEWTSPGFRRLIPKERHKPKHGHQSFSEWAKITLGPKGSKDDSLDSLLVCVCVCVCARARTHIHAQVRKCLRSLQNVCMLTSNTTCCIFKPPSREK